ncbi:hypothetical protein B0H17DRAFT_650676 [Mycena rosella]|uniref:Uncharacterized protein n=1 Tax=Mycena rosella TaxID=1033263 RepID=A0AAD7DG34_MYCRO|nr:hypothetical protein B0H17DRAFT_650676 [Mycena rosella]
MHHIIHIAIRYHLTNSESSVAYHLTLTHRPQALLRIYASRMDVVQSTASVIGGNGHLDRVTFSTLGPSDALVRRALVLQPSFTRATSSYCGTGISTRYPRTPCSVPPAAAPTCRSRGATAAGGSMKPSTSPRSSSFAPLDDERSPNTDQRQAADACNTRGMREQAFQRGRIQNARGGVRGMRGDSADLTLILVLVCFLWPSSFPVRRPRCVPTRDARLTRNFVESIDHWIPFALGLPRANHNVRRTARDGCIAHVGVEPRHQPS